MLLLPIDPSSPPGHYSHQQRRSEAARVPAPFLHVPR